MFCRKGCSKKPQGETCNRDLFSKTATPSQIFHGEFWENFQNSCSTENLLAAASERFRIT